MKEIVEKLQKQGIGFDAPLSQEEIEKIENLYEIVFPPDLREFYMTALPVGRSFPNWRDFSDKNVASITSRLDWPLDGMIFDIENNQFWYPEWGEKPSALSVAIEICKKKVSEAPRLIPIFDHRYIPSRPYESGNPILSVYQTDIIYYGENLEDYFEVAFCKKELELKMIDQYKHIEFWTVVMNLY